MRYVIVDDDPAYSQSRQRWLLERREADPSHPEVVSCDAMNFEEARALGDRWLEYDVAVVDGLDRRTDEARRASAEKFQIPYQGYQRFPGIEVVADAKQRHPHLLVIVTSTAAKTNSTFARAMFGAGAAYVYSHDDVLLPEDFTNRVCFPEKFAQRRTFAPMQDRKLANIPRLLAEADPGAVAQALGATAREAPSPRRATDRLMDSLREAFQIPDNGGPHKTHRQQIAPLLREFLGLNNVNNETRGGRGGGDAW